MVDKLHIDRKWTIIGIVILLVISVVFTIKNWVNKENEQCYIDYNNTKIPVGFCYDDVKSINVNISNEYGALFTNNTYYKLLFFYPEYTGNYSVALVNLYLKFNKTLPVCLYNYESCKFYTNISIEDICNSDRIQIYYNTDMYDLYMMEFPTNITVPIVLNLSYDIGVFEYGNCIVVSGDVSNIRKVVSRFAYWVYGEK